METLILRGYSEAKAKLILKLAKELNFSARKLTQTEVEEMGIAMSIDEGIKSGVLGKKEKAEFLNELNQ
ncbi:MAG TPA: hypothetical protein PKH79_03105 [Prolixibacteraceae bacterium]|nr:hypothetical protein [Prolixibacteraceae bacterium]